MEVLITVFKHRKKNTEKSVVPIHDRWDKAMLQAGDAVGV